LFKYQKGNKSFYTPGTLLSKSQQSGRVGTQPLLCAMCAVKIMPIDRAGN